MTVACPSVLFTLGAVGRIPHQVGQIGIICCPPKTVDKCVRSMNRPFLRNITMHKVGSQTILIQYKGVSACYFHVSETFIIESCHKFILSLSTQNEDVRLKRIGVVYRAVIHINIWRIHSSVVIQPLTMFQSHYSSLFPGHFNAGDSCHIAGKIEYIRCVIKFLPGFYGDRFYCTNRLHLLWHHILWRNSPISYSIPFRIVKVHGIPAFLFQTGVVMLGCINAIKDQCAGWSFPVPLRRNDFNRTILISNPHIHTESRTVTPWCTMKVPHGHWLMIIPSIAQQHTNRIFPFLYLGSNIISNVEITPVKPGI